MSPILAPNRHRYPADWPEIRERILARARNRCEECGVPNHTWGYRDGAGQFHQVRKRPLIEACLGNCRPPFDIASDEGTLHIIEIVLTVSHTDHDPGHCSDDNLRALCQQCHLKHDKQLHLRHARETRRAKCLARQPELFL